MAKLTDRTALTTPADGDLYVTTDVSDLTDAVTGTDKKITWANIKATLKTYFDTLYAGVLGADDNYVTDAEKTKLANLSGTNTGDQNLTGLVPYTGATADVDLGTWDLLTDTVGASTSAGLLIESQNGTDVGLLGAGNTANVAWYGNHNFSLATQDTVAGFTGAGKTLGSLATATYPSLTELSYVKGVTSAVQTQITAKPTISSGAGAPASTPTKVGDIYIDTTGDDAYIAVGTASSADWEKTNDGAGGGISDGDKGDITVSGSGATWTIDNGVVTLAKQADMATASVVYRKTIGVGAPEVQTIATLKSDLGLTGTNSGDQTTIVGITGTKAQFDTAVTDGNFLYVGDAPTSHTHTLSSITDITATATEVNYIDGVTSAIQGQIDAKLASSAYDDATAAEVNTGTSTAKYVSPDSLAGSNLGIRYFPIALNGSTSLTTSDKFYFRVPAALTGMNLVSVTATVGTGAAGSSSSGTPTFTVKNVTDNNQMLSTSLTVDASEYTSATAATPAVINASFDDVVTDDLIEVACTTAGTGVTYAVVTLGFQLP